MQHSAAPPAIAPRPRLDFEERRRVLVEVAKPLFARKGFAGTTTREIARAGGVSEALLFQHFPSKAALYQAIMLLGCEGDPALGKLEGLEPSTDTLIHMTRLLLQHFVMGGVGVDGEEETRHRLMLHSLLEDAEYARLVFQWVMDSVFPLFQASMEAAQAAGDLEPVAAPVNGFWFGHHVAALIAFGRLAGPSPTPYAGDDAALVADAARFILRGLGLKDAAMARAEPWLGAPHFPSNDHSPGAAGASAPGRV